MVQHTHTPAGDARALESDWGLVAAAQAGETEAFGELFSRYHKRIAGLVHGYTRDYEVSADLASETFARALDSLDRARPSREDAWPWLSRIATNLVHDHHRRSDTRRVEATEQLPEPRGELPAGGLSDDAATVALADLDAQGARAIVGRLLAGLPDSQREALQGWMADEPHAVTAAQVGRSPAAVKQAGLRGRATVRERLAADGISSAEQAIHAGHHDRASDGTDRAERLADAVERARGGVAGLRSRARQVSDDPATRPEHHLAQTGDEREKRADDGTVGLGVAS